MLNTAQNKKLLVKLTRALETYEPYVFTEICTLPFSMYETSERLTDVPEAALFQDPVRRPQGRIWGGEGRYCWFRASCTVLDALAGRDLFLRPQFGGYEAMLWVDGTPRGTFATKIVVTRHGNHYCDCVCQNARAGQKLEFAVEFYAGHYVIGEQPFQQRPQNDFVFTAESLSLCVKNQDVLDFLLDLRVLLQLADKLPEDSFRRGEIMNALTETHKALLYDPETVGEAAWRASLANARQAMAPALARRNGDSSPQAVLVGHSHIDTAWLWPMAETVKKIARTASNQFNLLDQYPEYRFIQSASYHSWLMEKHYPAVFSEMQRRIAGGRYEPNGAVWVECDCNIPSGEALVRQFLWGQLYTQSRFGYLSDTFWLPDTFGYSAAIPQIMRGFGVKYFLTTKLAWNDTNDFPYDTFQWTGIDGSQVLTHFFVIDTWPDPAGLLERVDGIGYRDCVRNKQAADRRLIAFGYGDGGGGPQFEMIEAARRLTDLEGCPKVSYDSVSGFMQKLEARGGNLPVYDGELYLELHRGTLTNKQQIKKNNRLAENALRLLELRECQTAVSARRAATGEALRPLWNTLLVNQFHDILPGSCISAAHDQSIAETTDMLRHADALLRAPALPEADSGVAFTIFNPLDEACSDAFYLPALPPELCAENEGVTLQPVVRADGTDATAVYGLSRPALGSAVLRLRRTSVPGGGQSPFVFTGDTLTTPHLRVRFDGSGAIISLITRADGMEWCGGPMNQFLCGEDVPAGWDGWDIDADCAMKLAPTARLLERRVTVNGPMELRIHSVYAVCEHSTLTQDAVFRADTPLVEWESSLVWNEKHRLLKTAFHTNVRARFARCETQFGCIQRPVTRNDSREQAMFEVCNHRYTDLSEPSRGISILNDCKYGISTEGGTLALTLAKGGTRPDPRGDAGTYTFRYGILPHAGGFSAAVARAGMRFDRTPLSLPGTLALPAFLWTDRPNIVVETVKPCEDSGHAVIARLYECEGTRTRAFLHTGFETTRAEICDMMERPLFPIQPGDDLNFGPFEIKTIKLYYDTGEVTK